MRVPLATRVLPFALALVTFACADTPFGPADGAVELPAAVHHAGSQLTVAHGAGNGVYFLPPLVHSTDWSGEFDGARSPVVVICAGAPDSPCDVPVARFDMHRQPKQPNAQVIRVDNGDQHYIVNWGPRRESSGVHRIFVVENDAALAHIDVLVVDQGTAVRDAKTGELRVIRGGLPIKFRMEVVETPPEPEPEPVRGLWGEYFDWRNTALDFNAAVPILQRVDPVVDFSDMVGNVDVFNIGQTDRFMARWTGFVEPEFSETYQFCVSADDGTRLWVDGTQLIDDWFDHSPQENCGSVALTAGQKVTIRLEWYEHLGGAVVRLMWQSPSRAKQVIPSSALTPP